MFGFVKKFFSEKERKRLHEEELKRRLAEKVKRWQELEDERTTTTITITLGEDENGNKIRRNVKAEVIEITDFWKDECSDDLELVPIDEDPWKVANPADSSMWYKDRRK